MMHMKKVDVRYEQQQYLASLAGCLSNDWLSQGNLSLKGFRLGIHKYFPTALSLAVSAKSRNSGSGGK